MPTPLKYALYRPSRAPMAGLPLGARSVGHYRLPPGWRDAVRVKPFVQIFWGIRGTGNITIDRQTRRLGPRQVAVYLPDMRHEVYAGAEPWEYCWWTMDGPLAAGITAGFGLTADIFDAGAPPLALLRRLRAAIADQTPAGERRAGALAYRLLSRAAGGQRDGGPDRELQQALDIMHAEWREPDLCIKRLADRLDRHRSCFTRRFEAGMGLPPADYLIRLRVQNALSMLQQTDLPIAKISRSCGYEDPNYFARLIRRHTGCSPSEFRRQHQ